MLDYIIRAILRAFIWQGVSKVMRSKKKKRTYQDY